MSVTYISFDCESVGGGNPADIPLINIGFVAYNEKKEFLDELSINLKPQKVDPDTLTWWKSTPELLKAYEECTKEPVYEPEEGMKVIETWVKKLSGRVTWVAYPSIYDGSMLYFYWYKYLGHPSGRGCGFNMIDIRSFASGKLGISYADASKERHLKPYVPLNFPHTHTGIDDAREQMFLYFNILECKKGSQ